jgi:hypothetical protein
MATCYYYYESTREWWTKRDGQDCHHLPPTTLFRGVEYTS